MPKGNLIKYRSKVLRTVKLRLRSMRFGKSQMSVWVFGTILFQRIMAGDMSDKASAVAFNLTVSVFPFVIFLFTLLPYFPVYDVSEKLFAELKLLVHPDIYAPIYETIHEIISKPRGGLLSFSFLGTIYTSSSGMGSFMSSFNGSLGVKETRNFVMQKVTSISLIFSFVILLTVSMTVMIGGEIALEWFLKTASLDIFLFWGLSLIRYLVAFLSFFLMLIVLYQFAPSAKTHFKHQSFGSAVATLGVFLVSAGFSKYIVEFNTYNKLYGAIGTMIAFMAWMFAVCFVIILGFEIIVSIEKAKRERRLDLNLEQK